MKNVANIGVEVRGVTSGAAWLVDVDDENGGVLPVGKHDVLALAQDSGASTRYTRGKIRCSPVSFVRMNPVGVRKLAAHAAVAAYHGLGAR
ncbi:hypothetical protein BRL53_07660 [Corynebacterium ulcerans]|nr:hypothetical protein [Corynebacterium ulcerans]PLV99094.1 hypothetical protein BRL53_07660 [Corynebacterium ulcerans]